MNKDLVALNDLTNQIMQKEQALVKQEEQYALASKDFAAYLEQRKRQQDELEVLKSEVKDFMIVNNIQYHDTGTVELKLSSTGKYTSENVDAVPDDLCKIVRQLDNKKIKAYEQLHGELPEHVKPAGYRLNMTVKGAE